jgi:hypothetical protein
MVNIKKILFASKSGEREKRLWYFPENVNAVIDNFVVGSDLDNVVILWGDGTKNISPSFNQVDHNY